MATPSPEVSQCATTSGTEYTMQTNLTHYEDITQLEDDILCFLPTVSDIDVFGCEVDLIELDAQLPLPEAFHTALLQQKKLQIVVRPCMVDTPSGNSKQMIERATLKPYESLSIHAEKLLTEPFTQHLCFDMWKLQQACSTQALRPPGLSAAAESQAPPLSPRLGRWSLPRLLCPSGGCGPGLRPVFFFARVWALCVPRGTSHRVEFR